MNIALNLRLEDAQLLWKKFVTHQNKLNIPFPILNKAQLRYRVQQPPSKHSSGTSMKGGDCLQKKATKRIKKDFGTETYSLPITGTAMDLPPPKTIQSSDETSSEEEEAETTFQLLKLRHKQYKLRQRILKLMSQNIE